jgi:hypothetical protein
MLRFFQSIFGSNTTAGSYPESLVKAAIERAVDGTDPWMRAVAGYKKKMRPAVVRAFDHIVALVDGMPSPIVLESEKYDSDQLLRTFFISKTDMWNILTSDRNLAEFQRGQALDLLKVYALLAIEKQEKIILDAELSGDIVQHDIPQIIVSFEAHRLIDPAINEYEARHKLKRRAFDHLLSIALRRITMVKTERKKLELHRELLQSKLNLLHCGGWGFGKTVPSEILEVADVEDLLDKIETQLLALGGDDRMFEVCLDIVTDVLGRPEEHLWTGKESLIVDRMGIKRSQASSDIREVTLDMIFDDEGRSLVFSLVAIPVEATKGSDRA